jgi:RNA polymerase sigma-70 factor (ECF subfamily)
MLAEDLPDRAADADFQSVPKMADTLNDGLDLSDQELLLRIATQDEAALGILYDRYSRLIFSVALNVLRDVNQAEDVLQDVLLKVWRSPHLCTFSGGHLGSCLKIASLHKSLEAFRKRTVSTE